MKKIKFYLFAISLVFLALFLIVGCKNNIETEKLFSISRQNFELDSIKKIVDNPSSLPGPQPTLPLPSSSWYANLVIVFDSSSQIYMYQTKYTEALFLKTEDAVNAFSPNYPFFINLKPEQLITFSEKSFIEFIKTNNNIFHLDSTFNEYTRFFVVASNTDTIKNPAFYEMFKMVKSTHHQHKKTMFWARMTTEEENNVIYCKKRNIEYNPNSFKWTGKYLDGKCLPFTKEYDVVAKKCYYFREAIDTYNSNCTKAIGAML
jgi:hypothetical protein